jgi:hypothetical protein
MKEKSKIVAFRWEVTNLRFKDDLINYFKHSIKFKIKG